MNRNRALALLSASVALIFAISSAFSANPFETKLSADRQIVQALDRLTFGPRPGDEAAVRRMGLEKWIDLQLHPARIPQNPALDAALEPYETLRMQPAAVANQYARNPQLMMMAAIQSPLQTMDPQQRRKLLNGTAEERTAVLSSLDPEARKKILADLPPTNLESLPAEIRKEAEDDRREQMEQRQAEAQRRNPPLTALLSPEERTILMRGTPEEVHQLIDRLDPEKRVQVAGAVGPQVLADFPELRREGMIRRAPMQVMSMDLKAGRVLRAVYSSRQLEEVLTDFWLNHFNVFEGKNVQLVNNAYRAVLADYENNAIRPHVLGHFKDLLLATAQHPAMLWYLDNWQSMSTDTPERMQVGPFARPFGVIFRGMPNPNQPRGLNENYGREIMELHTLGVGGGYTQKDVIEVARCFTGWTVHSPEDPRFEFFSAMHDDGEKTVLGHKIAAGGGEKDGLEVIEILSRHPSTAHFISKQLAQRFVADDPPAALIDRMAATFLKTDGDLRAVMQTMFSSPEFFSEGAWQAKVKSPFELVVSAIRAIGATSFDPLVVSQKVADLGEPIYGKVEPNGYPLTGDGWLGTSDLLGRMNFAAALVSGKFPGLKLDMDQWGGRDAQAIARELMGRPLSPSTLEALGDGLQGNGTPPVMAGLILGSPEFNRR